MTNRVDSFVYDCSNALLAFQETALLPGGLWVRQVWATETHTQQGLRV